MKKFCSSLLLLCLLCSSLCLPAAASSGDPVEQFNSIAHIIAGLDGEVTPEQIDELSSDLQGLDLSQSEQSSGLTGSMVDPSGTNLQFLFAQLQMELAQSAQQTALDRINEIEAAQQLSSETAGYLNTARQQLSAARAGQPGPVPSDLLSFLQAHSLYLPSSASAPDLRDWENIVYSLEAFQEKAGMDIQSQMVYIQDYMSQYNSYTQGASSLSSYLAGSYGMSGSGTMLGAGGAGVTVTALIIGLAAGALVTALVMRKKCSKA